MNPEQLGEALKEMVGVLEGITKAVPDIKDATVDELTEYLALAANNKAQLLTIHRMLEANRASTRRTA